MINLIEQYLFELTERLARFYIHIDAIRDQFYLGKDHKVIDKLSFLESYEQCLERILSVVAEQAYILHNVELNEVQQDQMIECCVKLFKQLTILHEQWLTYLPRPSEPVELRRFCRVIEKQVIWLEKGLENKSNLSIYISEKITDETYAFDPIITYKKMSIDPLLGDVNTLMAAMTKDYFPIDLFSELESKQTDLESKTIHITMPRIDASNPCHWPVLVHEVVHHTMDKAFVNEHTHSIETDFFIFINTLGINKNTILVQLPSVSSETFALSINIDMQSWLTETWCDLVACLSMGYSYWYAQFSAFLNLPDFKYNEKYPPVLFRLILIKQILKHRFSRNVMERWEDVTTRCEDLINQHNRVNEYDFWADATMVRLLQCFQLYFLQHLFKKSEDDRIEFNNELNQELQQILRYTKDINLEVIETLVNNLEDGLPIPSIQIITAVSYKERPTSVQEILCAASIYRNTSLQKNILESLKMIKDARKNGSNAIRGMYKQEIESKFKRFDQAILRSIQVSEWFNLFSLEDTYELVANKPANNINLTSILVDSQIVSLLCARDLHIIPIFSLENQLGSTSLDIRLGTSFQLFSPNEYGVIDFANRDTVDSAINNLNKRDLDFEQSMILMPGQFILGHSMEYLKLPNTISARLEGRSSFARLGIQIHMTAGFVDPGFEGVLTYEIYNAGHSPVRLYPGLRIGQLVFSSVNEPVKSYSTKHTAKYKGLLEPHYSLQGQDYEIEKITRSLAKTKKEI